MLFDACSASIPAKQLGLVGQANGSKTELGRRSSEGEDGFAQLFQNIENKIVQVSPRKIKLFFLSRSMAMRVDAHVPLMSC